MKPYALTVALNAAIDVTYLLDGLAIGRIHTVAELHRAAGGKANNVARVLRTLGEPVTATGFAGGHAGAFIASELRRLQIEAQFEEIPGESRTCLAMVDRIGRTLTEVREKGPTIPPGAAAAFLDRFRRLLSGAGAVVLSGSLPPGLPGDYYAQMIAAARAQGVYTLLDSSGAALQSGVQAGPSLVKPNREELAAWAQTELPDLAAVRAAAERLRAAGAEAVAVSLGEEGLLYSGPQGSWIARPPAVRALNTVGSGDSLVAGFISGLLQGLEVPESLRLGVACGTANAVTAEIAAPSPAEIERFRSQVVVQPL